MLYRKPPRLGPPLKPLGFCCSAVDKSLAEEEESVRGSVGRRSNNECPVLRIREQLVERRRPSSTTGQQQRSSVSVLRALPYSQLGQRRTAARGVGLAPATDSQLELLVEQARAERQAQYEQRMDRRAAIGRANEIRKAAKLKKCEPPCWYTEFSLEQLRSLNELVDAMFKDKEEKTVSRTFQSLVTIGAITHLVRVDSKTIRKLINSYSEDPIKFMCEVYKAQTGHYFQDEQQRTEYHSNERIILSAIAFLELPKMITQLHNRLPPITKFKLPKKPQAFKPNYRYKKMCSPLLEQVKFPYNWRIYEKELFAWRQQYLSVLRPFVYLPKESKTLSDDAEETNEDMKRWKDKANAKSMPTSKDEKKIEEQVLNESEQSLAVESYSRDTTRDVARGDRIGKTDADDDGTLKPQQEAGSGYRNVHTYETPTDWTEPPTPCPYKYRRLLDRTGPLKTDLEFFSRLGPGAGPRPFPRGRDHLSLGLQNLLLDAEADLHVLTAQADRLTGEVKRVLEPRDACGPCCACLQTKTTHLRWHATKHPHRLVDGLVLDERDKPLVIGATALHSPAASLPELGPRGPCGESSFEPARVPSHDRFDKHMQIGPTAMVDGQPVRQLVGVSKKLQHRPEELLVPDGPVHEVRNVPGCACGQPGPEPAPEHEPEDARCYGNKFRPLEGRGYGCDCGDPPVQGAGCEQLDECDVDDFAGPPDHFRPFDQGEEYEPEDAEGPTASQQIDHCNVCSPCGKELPRKCSIYYPKNLRLQEPRCAAKSARKKASTCSCDSLSQYLQLDINQVKCAKPILRKAEQVISLASEKGSTSTTLTSSTGRSRMAKASRGKQAKSKKKQASRVSKASMKFSMKGEDSKSTKSKSQKTIMSHQPSEFLTPDTGGPYGYRTKSEEALPAVKTIVYLVDPPTADQPKDMVAVREGGRPCVCRENRNNRKELLYSIGGLGPDQNAVIEGVKWVTPEPSIRRSDEYIPEYELYDSPYEKKVCATVRKRAGADRGEGQKEDKDRSEDWNRAFKDPYLTDFFVKKRENTPCWLQSNKVDKEPRRLKVMKPVCECKNERKIVKRREDKQKWIERQNYLKSLKKESYLHIADTAEHARGESLASPSNMIRKRCAGPDDSIIDPTKLVIAAVTMQTPFATPTASRANANLPFEPFNDAQPTSEIMAEQSSNPPVNISETKSESKGKLEMKHEISKSMKSGSFLTKPSSRRSISSFKRKSEDKHKAQRVAKVLEQTQDQSDYGMAPDTLTSEEQNKFLQQLETQLNEAMRIELAKMLDENLDLISLKLPEIYKMPQLTFWTSYRVRGMHFTKEYKQELLEQSLDAWDLYNQTNKQQTFAKNLKLPKDRRKNFDNAVYLKRKIKKLKLNFYTDLRNEIVEIGRSMWRTMEFGKFPNILFKLAYFTYMPAKENDTYVINPNQC